MSTGITIYHVNQFQQQVLQKGRLGKCFSANPHPVSPCLHPSYLKRIKIFRTLKNAEEF
jgi:hypothetical protein